MKTPGRQNFTKKEKASWPEGFKRCATCLSLKGLDAFHKHSACYLGRASDCKECRHKTSKSRYAEKPIEARILSRAKYRANKKCLEFNLELEDIEVPKYCPVLGLKLNYGGKSTDDSPSIDRKDPSRGYVKGNVAVISYRANMIKSNATSDEIKAVLKYAQSCGI